MFADELARVAIVLDHQHVEAARATGASSDHTGLAIGRRRRLGRHRSAASTRQADREHRARRARRRCCAALIVPPCISTRLRTIASPRPSPLCVRVVDESACRKRSNMCGMNSGVDAGTVVLDDELAVARRP